MSLTDPRQAEIWALEEARSAAMVRGDTAALDRLASDGLRYTHSSGGQDSKQSWLSKIGSGAVRYQSVTFTEPFITLAGDTALVWARMSAVVVRGAQTDQVSSLYLAVWMRQPAGWRLAAVQSTPAPKT